MDEKFIRTALLLGEAAMDKLADAHVAVFGIGGVGGHCVNALARSGIGKFDLFDNDVVSVSNINRQIVSSTKTIGKYKVDVMAEQICDINPSAQVNVFKTFYLPGIADQYDLSKYDYIVDAIDTITAKIELIVRANIAGVPIISSMGAGNKLDPTAFEVTDIYKTSVCPLAKVMRRELKARNIPSLKVVYSKEEALTPLKLDGEAVPSGKRQTPGSTAFVPSVAGLIIAGEVVKDLAKR